ncbi:MAG: glycoside hydrolase [Akkermansiaceae bacterium]|jgi:hypothetical protein|nr:glycoside hydrolase [Akkermansiaceae bacterium]
MNILAILAGAGLAAAEPLCYRQIVIEDRDGEVADIACVPGSRAPRWAREVAAETYQWPAPRNEPFFSGPVRFVLPPVDEGEAFLKHNHQPAVTWLANGDLLAIWYSTLDENGTELTVLASRRRAGRDVWDPSAVFFKAAGRNMHGSALIVDDQGTLHHLNGMAPEGARSWEKLALLHRSSRDFGVTWSPTRAVSPNYQRRNQVIAGTFQTKAGVLVQPCDAVPGGHGGTALHLSRDHGLTWHDPGAGEPAPEFTPDTPGRGTIAGIHAGVAELADGSLLAFGRGDTIGGRMPMSRSADLGTTWTYSASPFPPIGGGQRLVLLRLREGPLLFVSFTCTGRENARGRGMDFPRADGTSFRGYGMFAAVSEDDGKTWPVRKLITPGQGDYDGGAWTGKFTATPDNAEHAGYLAATQTPDGTIHLVSSALHYQFNLPWLRQPAP